MEELKEDFGEWGGGEEGYVGECLGRVGDEGG